MNLIFYSVLTTENIPYVTADEAYSILKTQLDRFLALVKTINPADWSKPTACTLWTVRDILAHQAGGYASGTGYGEMIRQYARFPKPGQLPEDAINELQLLERASRSPEELIAELERTGPEAARNWAYGFRLVKGFAIPHAVAGTLSLRYLMWVTHSRDTWMHRLDICRATGSAFEPSAGQDGRIVALIMRDVAWSLRKKLDGKSLVFDLSGFAGGTWQVGPGEPAAVIRMDALDFSIFASGRFSYEEACARADLSGDLDLANHALRNILILF
jgi:uncharacterized protein (TIGR03083 family)